MKKFLPWLIACLFCLSCSYAEPTQTREWITKSGHKTKAAALNLKDGKVYLKKEDGKELIVNLNLLTPEGQKFLKTHFKEENEVKGSGLASAEGLSLPMGEMSENIEANGSHCHIYVPKSLKEGRKAPLLFYTHSGGGKSSKLIKSLVDAAELLGWVMAISVESSNKGRENSKHVRNCVSHILAVLPVDEERIHYTGNSGGAAQAFRNTTLFKAFGLMPNVGYVPSDVTPKAKVVYALGGGSDYNRYTTAHAANRYERDGFHRMSPAGHGPSPAVLYMDGMICMHCKYLDVNDSLKEEKADFEASIINWMDQIKETNPKRAYATACVVRDVYKISGSNERLNDALIAELSQDEQNALYYEGILDINKLSKEKFAIFGRGSRKGHFSKEAAKAAEKLKSKYGSVEEIDDVLSAIMKKTGGK